MQVALASGLASQLTRLTAPTPGSRRGQGLGFPPGEAYPVSALPLPGSVACGRPSHLAGLRLPTWKVCALDSLRALAPSGSNVLSLVVVPHPCPQSGKNCGPAGKISIPAQCFLNSVIGIIHTRFAAIKPVLLHTPHAPCHPLVSLHLLSALQANLSFRPPGLGPLPCAGLASTEPLLAG